MKHVTIAVGGIGAPLGQSIMRAALQSKREYKLIGFDIEDEARHIIPENRFFKSVPYNDKHYFEFMSDVLMRQNVDLVFLGSENEMLRIAPFKTQFERANNATFALSGESALNVGMDKLRTVELLRDAGLPYPETMDMSQPLNDILKFAKYIGYPCMVKGKRSGPPIVIRNCDELRYHWDNYRGSVIQEYLGQDKSEEYTVGVFHAPEQDFIDAYCMKRILRYGLTWRGEYCPNSEVESAAIDAVKALGAVGSVNVQIRRHKNGYVIHEFNVRCSSTTIFRALNGWNEIDMAVDYFILKKPLQKRKPQGSGLAVRFFKEIWVPERN